VQLHASLSQRHTRSPGSLESGWEGGGKAGKAEIDPSFVNLHPESAHVCAFETVSKAREGSGGRERNHYI
jgi:hypothetical protein